VTGRPEVDLAAEIAVLREEVATLRRIVEARRRPRVTVEDSALVLAIAAHARGATFTAGELVQHAALMDAEGLRGAIVDAIGSLHARKLGKRLRRLDGVDVGGGLQIVRIGEDRAGALWAVHAT
jgi:hypothetical protein